MVTGVSCPCILYYSRFSFAKNQCVRNMWLLYKILLVILHILAMPLVLILFVLLTMYKLTVCLIALIFQDFVGAVPSASTGFIADHLWTRPNSTIIAGVVLNANPTQEEIANLFEKVYDYRNENGKRCYRELGYYLVNYFGHIFWKKVDNFKVIDRIHLIDRQVGLSEIAGSGQRNDCSAPGSPLSEEPLTSLVEGMLREPYKRDQPLWDVYLIHNYNGKPNESLLLVRFHHLMSDGMSFVKLFFALTGTNELPDTLAKPKNSLQNWNRITSSVIAALGTALTLLTVGPIELVYEVFLSKDKHPLHFDQMGKCKLTGNWICSMSKKLDLWHMKKTARNYGCSVVHVILAGITSGLEKYFAKYHGTEELPNGFHYCVPLPLPGHPNLRLVNHWCIAKIYAKFGNEQPADKLEYFKKESIRCATASLPLLSAFSFKYTFRLIPRPLAKLLFQVKTTFTVILSNVVGPQDPRRKLGKFSILDMFFYMPIVQESNALAVGVISCNGQVRICLSGDTGCIPDRSRLEDLGLMICDELHDICKTRDIFTGLSM